VLGYSIDDTGDQKYGATQRRRQSHDLIVKNHGGGGSGKTVASCSVPVAKARLLSV
jgi:hypothetical protein